MDIVDRIISLCKVKGYSGVQLGEILGLKKSPITDWKNKKSSPTVSQLSKICEKFGVSSDYLIFGTTPDNKSVLSEGEQAVFEQLQRLSEKEKIMIAGAIPFIVDYQKGIKPDIVNKKVISISEYSGVRKMRSLRVFDMPSSAGTGLYLDSDDYTTMDFDSDIIPHGADFGVRIRGDSMIPFVNDDDIVFVKSQPELEDGEIGIVVLNNSALCKKYYVRDVKVLLVSLNPKYEPIELKEYDELHYVGKVVGRVTPEKNTKA